MGNRIAHKELSTVSLDRLICCAQSRVASRRRTDHGRIADSCSGEVLRKVSSALQCVRYGRIESAWIHFTKSGIASEEEDLVPHHRATGRRAEVVPVQRLACTVCPLAVGSGIE